MCTAGGRPTSARESSSASACPTGSQRISACTVGTVDSATTATTPPSPRQRTSVDGGHPAAQRVLGRTQILTAQQRPGVEKQRGAVTARRHRLGTRGGDDEGRVAGHRRDHGVAAGGDDGGAGKRPAEFFGGAAGADDDRADGVGPASGAAQRGFLAAAPPAHRTRGVPVGQRQRAGAVPAAGDGAAAAAGQRGHVSPARHLDENGMPGVERRPRGLQGHRRQPGAVCGRVALLGVFAVLQRDHPRRPGPHHRPGRHQVVRPAGCAPWPAPRRCASSRRSLRHNVIGVREASRPHGRADTARAARTGCRRRRPTPAPARDRRPERIPRCAFR